MAIITKPSIAKGTPATFTLSVADLLAHSGITDSYFQDYTNLARVDMVWKSSPGNQHNTVKFDVSSIPSDATPVTGTFSLSAKARDTHEIQRVKLVDKDGGTFVIDRELLTAADFDISLAAAAPEPVVSAYSQHSNTPKTLKSFNPSEFVVLHQPVKPTGQNWQLDNYKVKIKRNPSIAQGKLSVFFYPANNSGEVVPGGGWDGFEGMYATMNLVDIPTAPNSGPISITPTASDNYSGGGSLAVSVQTDADSVATLTITPSYKTALLGGNHFTVMINSESMPAGGFSVLVSPNGTSLPYGTHNGSDYLPPAGNESVEYEANKVV